MEVIATAAEFRRIRPDLPSPLGLVPTMGALHAGHVSLIRQARAESRSVAVTIFVNPTQFNRRDDLKRYPQSPDRDLEILKDEKVDVVFVPSAEEVYPRGFDTWVEVGELSRRLEGAARPGHFKGVATIVAKLFYIVRPDRAYFGQKDFQQTLVVKRLSIDLDLEIEIVVAPTVRESDGLACSSRNVHLNPEERRAASVLHQALEGAQELFAQGCRDADALRKATADALAQEPLARIEYLSVADAEKLQELDVVDRPALLSMAVYIGKMRLIDNVFLPLTPDTPL